MNRIPVDTSIAYNLPAPDPAEKRLRIDVRARSGKYAFRIEQIEK